MSYILDALKKSARERKRGSLPDMLTVQDIVVEKPKKRFVWPYLLAAALLVNAGVLVWWLVFSHSEKTKEDTAPKSSDFSANEAPETFTYGSRPASGRVSPEMKTAERARVPGIEDKLSEASLSVLPGSKAPKDARTDQKKMTTQQPAEKSNALATPENIPAKPKQKEDGINRPTEPSGDQPEVLDENKIYRLSELPSSIRRNLPLFSISALLYSSEPASRMVSINDQVMHEGEDLTGGVTLEEITKDGVVFRHQKLRFRVDIK